MAIMNELVSMFLVVPVIFLSGTVAIFIIVIYTCLALVIQLEEVLCPIAVA